MMSLFSITSLKPSINFLHFSSSSPVRGSNVYSIQRASKEDEGSYICKAKSAAGEMEEVLQVIVSEDANIIEEVCTVHTQHAQWILNKIENTFNRNFTG